MNITTFQDDLLELQDFAARLEQFIATEHEFVESGLVIALSSKYGSGKSTFLKMWTAALYDREEKPLVITLNAWESDYNGDPLFAIVSALAKTIQEKGEAADTLLEAAKDFGWFATTIGSQIASKLTGIDPVAAGDNVEKKKAKRREGILFDMDAFSIFERRRNAMHSLKNAIQEIISSSTPRAFFIVDELDRCRPDYAIAYLETIKHIFDIKGAIFILAADRKQLENSAKTAFGLELDFDEYYRKFIHREVVLPPISNTSYKRLAKNYVSYYLEREGSRLCFMKLDQDCIENIAELIGALKLTPRQIQEVFRTLGHMLETTEENKGRLLWCLGVGSIAMAVFKLGAPKIFHELGAQNLDAVEAINFLNEKVKGSRPDWWFTLFLTGGGLHMEEDESTDDLMRRAGLIKKVNGMELIGDLNQWRSGWGYHYSSRFKHIYEKIQQISTWN